MSLETAFAIGRTFELGSHTFEANEIKRFAAKYDPQPFHLSEEAAERSVFRKLCASGWHTAAMWMQLNVPSYKASLEHARSEGRQLEFGPAAGLRDLKWLQPVYVGDTISYFRRPETLRPLASRPGWHLVSSGNWGVNQDGATVIEFYTNVLMRA